MPKYIPDSVKLEAMQLYLEGGKTAKEIAEEISTNNNVVVKPPTVYAWAKKDNWKEQKAVARVDEQQKVAETNGQKFVRLQEEQLQSYTSVINKGYRELSELDFDRALDAARAIDIGAKGQREILSGMINLQFVQDVLAILVEEIPDQDVLNKIAVKLKTLHQQQEDQ